MPNDVRTPASKTPAGRAAATPLKEVLKTTSKSADAVKVIPGHGIAGRHAKREHLDTLSGNKDPGMFGRMFPKLPPLEVSDAKASGLTACSIDLDRMAPGLGIKGLVGLNFLKSYRVTIDFAKKSLRLEKP